jgi:hypothetical protein
MLNFFFVFALTATSAGFVFDERPLTPVQLTASPAPADEASTDYSWCRIKLDEAQPEFDLNLKGVRKETLAHLDNPKERFRETSVELDNGWTFRRRFSGCVHFSDQLTVMRSGLDSSTLNQLRRTAVASLHLAPLKDDDEFVNVMEEYFNRVDFGVAGEAPYRKSNEPSIMFGIGEGGDSTGDFDVIRDKNGSIIGFTIEWISP